MLYIEMVIEYGSRKYLYLLPELPILRDSSALK